MLLNRKEGLKTARIRVALKLTGRSKEEARQLLRTARSLQDVRCVDDFRKVVSQTAVEEHSSLAKAAARWRALLDRYRRDWPPATNSASVLVAYLTTEEGRRFVRNRVRRWARQQQRFPLLSLEDLEQDAHRHLVNVLWDKAPLVLRHPRAYLARIIERKCSDRVRSQRNPIRRPPKPRPNAVDELAESVACPEEPIERVQNELDVRELLAELRKRDPKGAAMLKRRQQHASDEEIAKEFNLQKVKTAQKHMERAIGKIRDIAMWKMWRRGRSVEEITEEFNCSEEDTWKGIMRGAKGRGES